ncbi:MAG: C10 family peptidase [Bacteroidales bacterium]|nr:C10 family peptidase [Bacteroidales bacterium]
MKNTLLIALIILFVCPVYSQSVSVDEAKKVAVNFMNMRRSASENIIKNVEQETVDGQNVIYAINFSGGGWVLVSANKSVVPVVGFNYSGNYKVNDFKQGAFDDWINNVKLSIKSTSNFKKTNAELSNKWTDLLTGNDINTLKSYTPGRILLNVPGRGHVKWSQDINNSGGCSPAYNKYCPDNINLFQCDCNRPPLGCAAVAMGQIMWYWQWPPYSNYRPYDWSLMPTELLNTTPTNKAEEIAHFLSDCAEATKMNYMCLGSWTTVNNTVDAFVNNFKYKAVDKRVKNDWPGNAWLKLIRAEIDAERPVFYRGDKSDLSTEKHFFVLDGYDIIDHNYFHFNFGWGYPGNSYNTSYQYLDDITPGDHDLNKNQMAIIGISPSVNDFPTDITDVPYDWIDGVLYGDKYEIAKRNINLPGTNSTLIITPGGSFTLVAGNEIVLKDGFYAFEYSEFNAKIVPINTSGCNISVQAWTNPVDANGELKIKVFNANTFESRIYNSIGQLVYCDAGSITGNPVVVWDGTGSAFQYFTCDITFRNNCGEKLNHSYKVLGSNLKSGNLKSSLQENSDEDMDINKEFNEENLILFPNPNNGTFKVKLSNYIELYNISIIDVDGKQVYCKDNIKNNEVEINLSNLVKGTYFLNVYLKGTVVTKKFLIAK